MATAPMTAEPSRMSFAKVAASAGKENVALGNFVKVAVAVPAQDPRKENIPTCHKDSMDLHTKVDEPKVDSEADGRKKAPIANKQSAKAIIEAHEESDRNSNEDKLLDAVKALNVDLPMPSLVVNGSGISSIRKKSDVVDGFIEDPFHRTDFGSELGTKPPSLDGKSITSGTTFALDEKESLRPDDSASVKAAEDDDTFSGRGSIVAGSRIGSEAAARAYRSQYYNEERKGMQPMQERPSQGAVTPQSGSSDPQATDDGKPKQILDGAAGPEAFGQFYRQNPDEKLLEALDSPKDRIFLLRLEQEVIEFVKASKEPFIDLPPCNSFCRMLTHKLADYYHMTHQVDAQAGAVRIFRTPFCRLPPSLTTISNPPTTGNTPPPPMLAMKIMRRGGEGDTGPSPSKTTSEAGSDGKDKGLSAKEKLSREEREAQYMKARERIFGKEEKTGDITPETGDANEMSRSSSVSTKDRASQNKRPKPPKQRRDDSESFDVRSQYTPFFPQPQPQPTWVSGAQYPMSSQPFNGAMQTNYHNPMSLGQYIPQTQQFGAPMMNNGVMQGYNNMSQYPQQIPQRYPQPHSAPITAYGSPTQSAPVAPQQWNTQPMYQSQYQSQGPMARGPPSSVPYAFGQLPSTANPADPKSQHPIPGSFNRHAFNPKTQSFVPGNTGLPVPQAMSHHGSPHHGSPHSSYNTYTGPQQPYGAGVGYNMARQGSNNSLPSYHASPHMAQRTMMHQVLPQGMPQAMNHGSIPQVQPQGMSMTPNGTGHLPNLPNYGNPSTLPSKPPTGI